MRNVFRIFRNDLAAFGKHFFALLIILAICILPALYAWFNIYAFWDPYGKTGEVQIAVVSDDKDYMDAEGNVVNMGRDLVQKLQADENIGYVVLDDADQAINDVYEGKYYAAVIVEPDFTYSMYNFLTTETDSPTITFYKNEKPNAIAIKIVEAAADSVKQNVNEQYIEAMVETLFGKLNNFSQDVQGDSSLDMLRNTLKRISSNLNGYSNTIDSFITANGSLVNTLNDTNSTLDYSIYLIGNERVNISDQIGYVEDSQTDLSLINDEVNTMLLGIQDSIQEAIFKLDRLYEAEEDVQDAEEQLDKLEQQYQELIDYISRSGLTGSEVEDALSALNTVKEKISELRGRLGLDGSTTPAEVSQRAENNQDAINSLQTDYEQVAVPAVYNAVTGYDYADLSNPDSTPQSMDTMMSYMVNDSTARIDNIQEYINIAKNTSDPNVRNSALEKAKADADIVEQETSALNTAVGAIDSAAGGDGSITRSTAQAASDSKSASDILEDILNGNRDIDLVNDLQVISDTVDTVRVTLTEVVYPAINTLLDNLQDSLGDVSSVLLDLSSVLGKAGPIVNELGSTFSAVNNALVQVKNLLSSYSNRISDLLSILDSDNEDSRFQSVLEFFDIDPASIAGFFARPVDMEFEAVYPVESYGVAMTPFYTMLAIWVGCVIINSVLKAENPVELLGATNTERFFGRYLIFFLISLIQTMIIMLGDLYLLGVDCLHPGLFLLTGVFTSLTCSMLAYSFAVTFGSIGKALIVVIMIIQIAGSGGSYPIELLPGIFQQIYLLFPFPYAINAMREAIAGLYQNAYWIYTLQLLIFFVVGLLIGLVLRRPLSGLNNYMEEQLEKTEMM